jgi:hypothetical protein
MKRKTGSGKAYRVALCSLIAALGTAVMLASGLVPILTYCSPLLASLFLIPLLAEFGAGGAWMAWGVTAVLALLLCTDKEAAFFYVFLGFYPILKPGFERFGRLGVLWKLLFFAAALAAMYGLILFVFRMDVGIVGRGWMAALYLVLTAVMLLFDFVIDRMSLLYERRLRPALFRNSDRKER